MRNTKSLKYKPTLTLQAFGYGCALGFLVGGMIGFTRWNLFAMVLVCGLSGGQTDVLGFQRQIKAGLLPPKE